MSQKGVSYLVELMDVFRAVLTAMDFEFDIFLFIFLVEKCFFG